MIYWTTYNFASYLLYKMNYVPMNEVLRTSFICSSIIGGYMTYIYPRKMIIHYGNNKKYNVHYPILVIGDLITHQLPLLDTFFIQNQYHICGAYLYPFMLSWYGLNNYYIKNTKKIYGIPLEKLLACTNGIFLLLGLKYHFFGKLIKNE
jgi:hypothetical protein